MNFGRAEIAAFGIEVEDDKSDNDAVDDIEVFAMLFLRRRKSPEAYPFSTALYFWTALLSDLSAVDLLVSP